MPQATARASRPGSYPSIPPTANAARPAAGPIRSWSLRPSCGRSRNRGHVVAPGIQCLCRRALQRAVKARTAYAYDLRRLGRRPASVDQLARMGQPVGRELRLAPEFHAPALRVLHSGPCPFDDQRQFIFGQNADQLPHDPARRRLGVDSLRERLELDALIFEVVEHGDEVAHTAAQPVELPHDERVAGLQDFEATGEGRALHMLAGHLVLEHSFASGLLQGRKLHRRILVVGADAGIAVFHASIIGLTFWNFKPLFSGAFFRVQYVTLCWTLSEAVKPNI